MDREERRTSVGVGRKPGAARRAADNMQALIPILPLALTLWFAGLVPHVAMGESFSVSWNWVPGLGVSLSFFIDGLSLLFSLLVTGLGTLIFVYARGYIGQHHHRARLSFWLLAFMFAMLGLVAANNVMTLFVFWELTSFASYMLIGFKHESEAARKAALQALLVTGFGGLSLLVGLLLISHAGGSYELTTLVARSDTIRQSPLVIPMIALILVGAFTKSAQFPFHFWLPAAMQAPTPVSAYLHSATMVKAGVYLVARLNPIFREVDVWQVLLVAAGSMTSIVGGWLAWQQTDLKRTLAYSTISALGLLMLLLGIGSPLAMKSAIVLLVAHSLYKGALFLVAGTVEHATGSRDVRQLGGLLGSLPLVAIAALMAGASLAGLPPAAGFLAKELIYESCLVAGKLAFVGLGASLVAGIGFVAVAGLVTIGPFFGKVDAGVGTAHRPGWQLVMPPLVLGVVGLTIGLFPAACGHYLIAPAVAAVGHDPTSVTLKLWPGFHLPLLLSCLTLLAGLGLFVARHRLAASLRRLAWLGEWGPSSAYDRLLRGVQITAAWQSRLLQNGRLRTYLLVVLISFSGLLGATLMTIQFPTHGNFLSLRLHETGLVALILGGTWMSITSTSRLAAVCALGVIGYAIAMMFVMFGEPDLAMTQLAIETLTVILFVFVIYRLPKFAALSSRRVRLRDAFVAIMAGGLMTAIAAAAAIAHAPSRVSPFFAEHSLASAKGRNMVNVILVDFRGLDTLAEITVLAVAAIGIYSLMRLRVIPKSALPRQEEPASDAKELTSQESSSGDRPVTSDVSRMDAATETAAAEHGTVANADRKFLLSSRRT